MRGRHTACYLAGGLAGSLAITAGILLPALGCGLIGAAVQLA